MSPPLVSLRDIRKVYGAGPTAVHALAGIDLNINRGEFVAVMGASGSGKSTAMNILGCLDKPTSGTFHFSGVDVTGADSNAMALLRRNYLGFVFQGFNLLARTTALENVELPLIYRSTPKSERRRMAMEAIRTVGLEGREHHAPSELSGGQQQRVAIARAIVTNPVLLLADEPTGNLDSARSHDIMKLLTELNRVRGLTIVMVTHESEMAAYAARQVIFADGQIKSDTTSAPAVPEPRSAGGAHG
jgi:putative ABC transport system ATP-binding protein